MKQRFQGYLYLTYCFFKLRYLVNSAIETVFIVFVTKFDVLFPLTREHVFDGYWQDQTFSMLFENGSTVITIVFKTGR